MICSMCPRKCFIDRNKQIGFCGVKNKLKVALVKLHFDEEPCISGTKGSGTIFFSGCNLKCIYCQNFEISSCTKGCEISVKRLANIFMELEEMGAENINLVTPTHFVDKIISALKLYTPKIPIIYNCGGYESIESIKKLKNYIDIYLTDFKYYDDELAKEYSNAKNYKEIATCALREMFNNQPKNIFNLEGIMLKGVIVRHLVLPNNTNDSVNILNHLFKTFGSDLLLSLMSQYTPCFKAEESEKLNRVLKPIEYKRVINECVKLGMDGYAQELSSATIKYIPKFDLSGVIKK